jgi:alkanesulfonate monooxygenase SsuD/methylene tetrahydromethanopterin reductase-like flavin-dependent oxidoreductase (luciferase family)
MDVRLGTLVLPSEPWAHACRSWKAAEELGFDVAYTADHLTHPTMTGRWWADGWTTLAAAAQVTRSLELGTLVASAAVRRPAAIARTSATLADLSGGRFVLGLGAGTPYDAVADGGTTPTARDLAERYAGTVDTLRALWSGDAEHPEAAAGSTAPFLLLAAHGPRGYELVARYGDGWSTYGGPAAASASGEDLWSMLSGQLSQVATACEARDRDPATLRRSLLLGYGPDRPLANVEAFVDAVGRARELGFDEVVVYWPHGKPEDRFWADPEVFAGAVSAARRG